MELSALRNEIDLIDNQIIELLDRRFDLSSEIGKEKKQLNMNINDTSREDFILNKIIHVNSNYTNEISEIYKEIFVQSKRIQK